MKNKNVKTGLVVLARTGSKRLHKKVLQLINGKRTIDILLDHVIPNDEIYDVVMAIPKLEEDDILQDIAVQRGIECYRGEDDSPLHRLWAVSQKYDYDYVIRITTDDILIDQYLLRQQLNWAINGNLDYCYMRRCPEGIAGEIIKSEALDRVVAEIGDQPVEYISYHFKNENFSYNEFYPPSPAREYQFTFRLTLDYLEDLQLLRELYNALPEPVGTLDIINFLRKHKTFMQINKLPDITVYTVNYNYSKYILDAMKSVHEQDWTDYEYIVIDDNSTDQSMNKIAEYYTNLDYRLQRKTKILRNDTNIGLPATCNKILEQARGKHILRLDADDVLKPNALRKMFEKMRIDNTQACISSYHLTKPNMTITSTVNRNDWHPGCAMLNRWVVNELKYKENLQYLEGKDFFDRFKQRYKASFLNEPLWLYRKHEESKTADENHPDNL